MYLLIILIGGRLWWIWVILYKNKNYIPFGKGANDLAQLAFMTFKLSEITTDPSAPIPQKSFKLSSPPCTHIFKFVQLSLYELDLKKTKKKKKFQIHNFTLFPRVMKRTYKCSKHSASLGIIDYKPEITLQIPEDLMGRVWASVTEGPVCLDGKRCLVGTLW